MSNDVIFDSDLEQKLKQYLDSDTYAPEIVGILIGYAVDNAVSDILIEPGVNEGDVRVRIDGILHLACKIPMATYPSLVSRIKVMSSLDITVHKTAQEGKIDFEHNGHAVNLRVAIAQVVTGESIALRLHDTSTTIYDLASLGLRDGNLEKYKSLLKSRTGLFLVSGPTGSGKTTTLYSSLQSLNDGRANIIAIEDPIEYILPGLNQMQVDEEHGITFAEGLKVILRLNPDIIFVGEIRDGETAHIAIESALTGHLVLSTLHANNSIAVLSRLLDLDIEKFLLNSALAGIVSQRLVRKVCPHCQKEMLLDKDQTAFIYKLTGKTLNSQMVGQGCSECAKTGYKGRMAVYEVLLVDDALKRLISENATQSRMEQELMAHGFEPMIIDGINKVISKETTLEEVVAHTYRV